jgi:hypothetical protein
MSVGLNLSFEYSALYSFNRDEMIVLNMALTGIIMGVLSLWQISKLIKKEV